ncbi:MAG: DDE-type integrase/transposase/recombinase [Burkholderiaceae bacterium]|nr:DDE-type integrase/transposase/recombinase [Burkholderiaceae bacterium]
MTNEPYRQALALFRYGLIAEFLQDPPGSPGLYARLRTKADADYVIPGSTRTRVAPETLRHWIRDYRRGGFDALLPKARADRGHSRALPAPIADALLLLKEEQPHLSIPQLIGVLTERGTITRGEPPALSTVHRLLARAGLMDQHRDDPGTLDRRRFAFAEPGQLWMSDVMHGPSVAIPGTRTRRKTYLIAFIDDATRVIPYCAFALSENTQTFLPVFKQAILRRGLPQRLYVDNGANYRSQHLALVCARLGVALIHARPYQPAGKGKIERWFRTARAQLLARLTPADTDSLEALNRRLWAWVEAEYHHSPHRGLEDATPLDRWAMSQQPPRLPEARLDLDALFLFEARRRVQRDRTVSLNGTLLEVDAALVGERVTLRYDPALPPGRGIEVWHKERFVQRATPLDAYANCHVRRHRPTQGIEAADPAPAPRSSGLALRDLPRHNPQGKEPR